LPDHAPAISLIVPVDDPADSFGGVVDSYAGALAGLGKSFEILLVPSAGAATASEDAARGRDEVRVCEGGGAWGRAVLAGLRAATGEALCYTNWERTSADVLTTMLRYALRNPDVVFRANRRTRDARVQRIGSLLFNLECRAVLRVTAWDVNGTPKVFSRRHSKLLELTREDGLVDAEFAWACEREGYPVAEIPIEAPSVLGRRSEADYPAALRLYAGVLALRRQATTP
jgi:hypothetical protein